MNKNFKILTTTLWVLAVILFSATWIFNKHLVTLGLDQVFKQYLMVQQFLLPYPMLILSFFVFGKTTKIVKIIHHAVVSIALFLICGFTVYLYFFLGGQSAIGGYFVNFMVGVSYLAFLVLMLIVLGILKIIKKSKAIR